MLLLAIDTANDAGSLAVLKDGRVSGEISTASDEPYSSRLFRQLDLLLRESQLRTSDFDVFAVGSGPGSFTGLRVGLAAAKAWAEAFSKPIVAISGLEAVAVQLEKVAPESLIAPVLDARRGQIYVALYRVRDLRLVAEESEQVCTAEEFLQQVESRAGNDQIRFISPCPAVIKPILDAWKPASSRISRTVEPATAALAPIIGRLAFERARRGEFTDALHLDANYVRRSDAELLWKAL